MTPGARIAAAIEILDRIGAGEAAEAALTRWARVSRFAGSKDRAAIRDHVFDVLRRWRSDAARGGGESGRARMIGHLRADGIDPDAYFTGEGHSPAQLTAAERAAGRGPEGRGEEWDLPDWLVSHFEAALGAEAEAAARALTRRAPVTLRVNLLKGDVPAAARSLAKDGVATVPNPLAPAALTVTDGARRLRQSTVFRDGLVELQDAASQAVVDTLPVGRSVLDYCAGGGGKSLALVAQGRRVTAHDIDLRRMADLPQRAARAGVEIAVIGPGDPMPGRFDLVLCDAPCSGSGAWRRSPEGKWRLTPERLVMLTETQSAILDAACALVRAEGTLAYATCSVLREENEARIEAFCARHPEWRVVFQRRFPISPDGDGFFVTHLKREG